MSPASFRFALYANGFVLGFVLMGFEMLGSRYLNPHFGSGIYTWAALISVTLFALMVGYFLGGRLVDRYPSCRLLGGLVLAAAAAMALLPHLIGPMIETVSGIENIQLGVSLAAFLMLFVPITLIACYSPFAVRLLLVNTGASGRQTGSVYGISTCGNILGTLATTFWLIPTTGSVGITYAFAAVTAICAVILMLMDNKEAEA